jgi:hypothetical protein
MGRRAGGHNGYLVGADLKAQRSIWNKRYYYEETKTMREKEARETVKIDELCAWISESNRTIYR